MSERAHAHARPVVALAKPPASAMRPAASATARFFLRGAVLLLALLGLALEAACLPRLQPPTPLQGGAGGAAGEEKVRLGSNPPSCRGKCYECSPCTAVQVPTLSTGPSAAVARSRTRTRAWARADEVATLSNYKPVGWKCQCRDRLYEP